MKDSNPVVNITHPRKGLTQVEYQNGLILSVGTSDTHYCQKRYGVTLTCEVAVIHPERGLLQITECDTVAQLGIAHFEQLTERMLTLPVDLDEATATMTLWADF